MTLSLLRAACEQRSVEPFFIDAATFDFEPGRQLRKGDLLYRPAVSAIAGLVEQFLWDRQVATFYQDPAGPFFTHTNPVLLYQRAGLPVPRSVPVTNDDRGLLRKYTAELGGFPLVLKLDGYEGGVGVIRVDSLAALFSLADYTLESGKIALLCAYVEQAVHWRVIVLAGRAVASYRNVVEDDDFRSSATEDPDDCRAPLPDGAAGIAIRAAQLLRLDLAGVDLLEHPSGRLYLLEANFPCYFAHAQELAGVDVAGAMVDHLASKSRSLTGV
jgi:glutathione synthase/RimK-type ligase-like ATP-grasp enzyme